MYGSRSSNVSRTNIFRAETLPWFSIVIVNVSLSFASAIPLLFSSETVFDVMIMAFPVGTSTSAGKSSTVAKFLSFLTTVESKSSLISTTKLTV